MDKIREGILYMDGVEFGRIKNFEVKVEKTPYCENELGVKLNEIKSSGSFKNVKIAFENIKKMFAQIWEGVKNALFKIYSNNKEFRKLITIYNRTKKKRTKNKYYNKMIRFINNQIKQ